MPAYFFDSSALVKRFAGEAGSSWVIGILKPSAKNKIYIAAITSVEVIAAVERRKRTGNLSVIEANKAVQRFERSLTNRYAFVEVNQNVINRAHLIVKNHGLRGYDAVQLAACLIANAERIALGASPLVLISADKELNGAATAEKLTVDNPNNH